MAVRFCLLGDVEARIDGVMVDLGHAVQRCVLAALAVDVGRGVSDRQLSERVWGDRVPAQAGRTLASYVSRLRRTLAAGEVRIHRRSGGYVLTAGPGSVDLHCFRRLVGQARSTEDNDAALALLDEALDIWRGEPFAGLESPWFDTMREILDQERLTAELDRNDIELRLDRHHEILARVSAQAAAHPVDERCAGQLMLALYRCGRQADALECYEQIRQRLADQLGLDPGPALRQLHQRVLTAHPVLGVTETDAPRAIVPRHLPAPPSLFVGRSTELAELDKAVQPHTGPGGTVVISAIGGAGGIGKTVLALYWAHQNIDRFPDGQLYVDLRGFDPADTPTPPRAVMNGFLHALGVPTSAVPADLDAQVGLYRSLVAGKRMLVLLDNARDTAQVEPLLPGTATCTVIVTSRNHLTGLHVRGAHLVDLDVLTDDEARRLLVSRLDDDRAAEEPDAVTTLLSCCAGMPLAISIVAARATMHRDFPLTVLADELRDASTRLDAFDTGDLATNLRAVFSWSYRALNPETAGAFRLLGLAPGPDVSLATAAALTGLPAGRTRQLLRDLEAAHLVARHKPDRYRMHDLTRLYAAECADHDTAAPDRDAALRRLVDFYVHTAHAADLRLDPSRQQARLDPPAPGCHPHAPADAAAAMRWFDAEHACLLATQQVAATHGWHRAVWQLAHALHIFHRRRGYGHDELAVCEAAVVATERLADLAAQALAHRQLGDACTLVGRYDEALDQLREALALAERTGDLATQADTHQALSWAWEQQGDGRRALAHATDALRLYQDLGAPAREAEALNNVGWCAAQLGEFDQARTHCEAALALNRRDHHREGEAATLDSLGYIAHHTGDHRQAIDYYQQALAIFRDLSNTYEEANTLDNLGHPHTALGQHDQARHAWQQALSLYRSQHRTTDADRVLHRLTSAPTA